LLYGPRYIGTTSFIKALPNKSIATTSTIGNWERFKEVIGMWEGLDSEDTINFVIDKVTDLYDVCIEYICLQQGVDDIHELGSNKWKLVEDEFTEVLYSFYELPGIKWYITGEKVTEMNTSLYTGTLVTPDLNWVLEKIMPHITLQTLYMGVRQFKRELNDEGKEILTRIKASRVFICSPLSGITSGDSMGLLPARFPAGSSGEEAVSSYMKYMKGSKAAKSK